MKYTVDQLKAKASMLESATPWKSGKNIGYTKHFNYANKAEGEKDLEEVEAIRRILCQQHNRGSLRQQLRSARVNRATVPV